MAKPTATEIRNELEGYGISVSVLTDEWIERCRDEEIIPYVEKVTRQTFEGIGSKTEYYSGTGKSTLILNRRPVIDVTEIVYVSGSTGGNLVSTVEVIQDEGIVKVRSNYSEGILGPIFRKGTKNVKITYTYGYSDYPADISRAIRLMVAAKALVLVGSRTGGGSLSVQSHGRNYGSHGKYTDIRREFVYSAYSILKNYSTAVTGG